ncbi:hypothetical protein MKW92_051806 [Papaver armeniacum]|nr:hypothetical protein MKW92_051806 [Papaver armeniacum]
MGGFLNSGAEANSVRRWVWAANPTRPVGEDATLVFGSDGNLILADANGEVVWETKTANKNVTDIKLLSNGNLVLLDKSGGFVWQSFDFPSDTLLNGQAIRGDGSNKLASGSYSMSMERTIHLTLFFQYKKFPPFIYHTSTWYIDYTENVRYYADGKEFGLSYEDIDTEQERRTWDQPGYNTTLSMLRLDKDGNLRVYTYNGNKNTWEKTYMYFSSQVSECNLPEKCGVYGFCKNETCVSCPSSKGLTAATWSNECRREPIPSCETSKPEAVEYYKMEDVTSSMRSFNDWDFKEMTVDDCKMICSKDCKCTGFFYRKNEKSCLVATTEIFTLSTDYIGRYEPGVIDPQVDTYIKYVR